MQPFDPKTYNRVVLARYRDGGRPDEFDRYLLDLADSDDEQIDQRLEEVKRLWNNNKTQPPPIGPLVSALLAEHSKMIGLLTDGSSRRALRGEIEERRRRAAVERWVPVDRAIQQVYDAHQGIPLEMRQRIVEIGSAMGLSVAEVDAHVEKKMRSSGWQVVALNQVPELEPLPDAKARQIQQTLRKFQDTRQQELGDGAPARSLFEALGLQMDADPDACDSAIGHLQNQLNTQVRRDSAYGSAARQVLQLAQTNLGVSTIDRYRATMVHQVKASLEVEFKSASVDGRIDQQENQELLTKSALYGLTDSYANAAVSLLFKESQERGVPVARVEGARVEIILCVDCGAPDSIGSGQSQCLSCGNGLYRVCESCAKDVPRGNAICRYCGHSLLSALQVDAAVREGRNALAASLPAHAAECAARALQLDPESSEASALAAASREKISQAHTTWRTIREAINQQRLYAARGLLQRLVSDAQDVEDGGEVAGQVQSAVALGLAAVEARLRAAMAEIDSGRREALLSSVLELAIDSEEANRALAHMPPRPPEAVRAEIDGDAVVIRWQASPSPGVAEYIVTRRDGRAPISLEDGTRIVTTATTACTDGAVAAGNRVAYAVFATRAGAFSQPSVSAVLVTAFEAKDVRASVGDRQVRLSWQLPSPLAAAEVQRSDETGAERDVHVGNDGLVDNGLVNGTTYKYRVRLRYGDCVTSGVELVATPAESPRAVVLRGLETGPGGLLITWAPPSAGVVTVIRSSERLELQAGTEVSRLDLPGFGTLLPGAEGTASDPDGTDGFWYTPATVVGDRAVIGSSLRWTDIPAVTDVKARGTDAEVVITWAWPETVKHAMVLWREGEAPQGLDDPDAHRQHVSRAVQQQVGGGVFRLTRERQGTPLRIAVYGAQMRDGELIVGSRLVASSHASLDASAVRTPVTYDVRISGGFGRRSLELMLSGAEGLPEIVLVAKAGDVIPFSADDGQPIARIGGSGPSEVTLALGKLPRDRPLSVRAFLTTDGANSRFSLKEPSDLTKLILR